MASPTVFPAITSITGDQFNTTVLYAITDQQTNHVYGTRTFSVNMSFPDRGPQYFENAVTSDLFAWLIDQNSGDRVAALNSIYGNLSPSDQKTKFGI